ncbi:MAG: CueP family metal-binding protein [bacterium]|nr:CueP family metal-binding protein [bacterium]
MSNRFRRSVSAITASLALLLAGCAGGSTTQPGGASGEVQGAAAEANNSEVLAPFGLSDVSAAEVVDLLDVTTLADRNTDLFASVRPSSLLVRGPDGSEEELPLPEDSFYLSFAPYVNHTHDCFFHSLTTCVGELQNEPIDLSIVNAADGTVVVDETVTTFDNGFYGLWLPADEEFDLSVSYSGMSVTSRIGTGEDDPTCVTTLPLT